MNPVGVASLWAFGFMVAASLSSSCGGQTGSNNAAQGGLALTGGEKAGSGGAIGMDSTGGAGSVGGTSSTVDSEMSNDAGVCDWQASVSAYCGSNACCGSCWGEMIYATANMIDCAVQLHESPPNPDRVVVVISCVILPPTSPLSDAGITTYRDGWAIDYSITPARLVLGESLCEEVQEMGNVPLYAFVHCGSIC